MEYSSSEDNELVEDYIDVEDDTAAENIDQGIGVMASQIHRIDPSEGSMPPVGNELLMAADVVGKNDEPYMGMEFESDAAARAFYNAYALRFGFGIRVARSRSERRKGVEVLVMKRFVCLKEGHHKKKPVEPSNKKKRKRLSIRDGCPAMMEVVRRGPDKWVVTKLVLEHTHVIVSADRAREIQLRRLSGKFQEHENQLQEVRKNVFGDTDAQCQDLFNYFKRMQSENSGFFYSVQVDSRNCVSNAVWVDARARMTYTYFGDAVYFDTTYSQNENMLPFAAFIGVNHHGETVVFGCALNLDKTESSYAWILETWLTAMDKRLPFSMTTDEGKTMAAAVAKVFPQCFHRICRWRILSRCKKRLSEICTRFPGFHDELKRCVNGCDTVPVFDMFWGSILDKYGLRDDTWLQSLYEIRHKWVPAYLTSSFFAELSLTHRVETVGRFYRNNFCSRVSLNTFITRFDQYIDSLYASEAQKDLTLFPPEQLLKTNTDLEKQAAGIYTRAAFETFQVELIEALQHYAVKVQDGPYLKYYVERDGDPPTRHTVFYNVAEKKAWCDCCRFAFSAILCRHVLGVFILAGVIMLPDTCITKRWTKKAKTGPEPIGLNLGNDNSSADSVSSRYNDLVRDAMKCAEKGAVSARTFRVAKEVLSKAFMEIKALREKLNRDAAQNVDSR